MTATTSIATDTAVSVGSMLVQQQDHAGRTRFYGNAEAMPQGITDTDELLAMAGLDFGVELRPLTVLHPEGHTVLEDYVATVRTDTDQALGVVSPRYQPIQNADAFGIIAQGVNEAGATWEAAGTLRGGRRVWGLLKLAEPVDAAGEKIDPFLLYINDHSGGGAIQAHNTPVRPRCTNAFPLAMRKAPQSISIRHTGDTGKKLDEARRVFARADEYLREFATTMDDLARTRVTPAQLERWVKVLWPDEDGMGDRAARNRAEARSAVLELCTSAPNLDGHHGTAYAFVNGVGEYLDWTRNPDRTGTERMDRLVTATDTPLKNRALALALAARSN